MHLPRLTLIVTTASLLGACSITLPVRGQVQNSTETFTGTATGGMSGGGTLTLLSSKGTTCRGNFVYAEQRRGGGVFNCDDGRSGPFQFVSTGRQGNGYGDLGSERFTFTFGK